LWRGNAYADVGDHAFSRAEASRLGELRLAAVESRVDAQLATAAPNVPAGLVAELEALVAEHPHRERLWVQLMAALYRLGRRGDAIAAFRQARIRLAEDLGVDVGPGLHAAERGVLAGDPALNGIALAATVVPEALAVSVSACVGRDEEIAWLETALDLAATRRGQARLIIGGPGLGKTRLIAEVAQRAAARGVSIRLGRDGDLDGLVAESDRLSLVIVDDLDLAPRDDLPRVVSFIRAASDRPVLILLTAKDPVRVGDLAGLPKLVLTALGDRAVADVVRLYAPGTTDATAVAAIYGDIEREATAWLSTEGVPPDQRRLQRLADLRYRHQGFEITDPWNEPDLSADGLVRRFHERHRRLYTYALEDAPVEIVTLRVSATGGLRRLTLPRLPARRGSAAQARTGRRRVYFEEAGGWVECATYDRESLPPGGVLAGPAIVEQLDATTVVLPGQRATVDRIGNLIVRLARRTGGVS